MLINKRIENISTTSPSRTCILLKLMAFKSISMHMRGHSLNGNFWHEIMLADNWLKHQEKSRNSACIEVICFTGVS